MQYFTPELFVRLQTFRDATELNAVHAEWDSALARYREQVRDIEPLLSPSLQRFLKEFCLHDAAILAMDRGPRTLTITLRLDPPQPFLLTLTYSLVDEPEINRSALPAEYRSPQPLWLYEELSIAPATSPKQGGTIYQHDILLSNGWEVRLRFWKLAFSKREALFPAPQSAEISVSQSA